MSHVPAVGLKAGGYVFTEGPVCRTIQGYAIVVVNPAEVWKFQVPRKRSGLAAYAFHHVTVATYGIDVVVENIETGLVVVGCQPIACDRHANAVSNSLPQRTGRRFNPSSDAVFGMPGSLAVCLAELLYVIQRHCVLVEAVVIGVDGANSCEMEHRVEKHGCVAVGEDEAIAIGPNRVLRIIAEKLLPQHIRDRSESHGGARVS